MVAEVGVHRAALDDKASRGLLEPLAPISGKSVERAQLFGVPTYRFIAAKQRLSTTFDIFLAEIPATFNGVNDVRAVNGRFEIVPR